MRKRSVKRRRTSRRTGEGQIQDGIRDMLNLKYKWRAWRTNVHRGKLVGGGYVKCSEPGHADVSVLIPAGNGTFHILHIECKAPKGKQSFEQNIWSQCVISRGEHYIMARTQEEVEAYLRDKGWAK